MAETFNFGENLASPADTIRAQLASPLDVESQGLLKSFMGATLPVLNRVQSLTLRSGDTTFDVRGTDAMSLTGAAAVSISTLTSGYNGQLLTLIFNDANVTLVHDATGARATMNLGGNITSAANTTLQLVHNGTSWQAVTDVTQIRGNDHIFGDGNDGDVTIAGATTLTRDMFYNNLTVNNGVTLNSGGYFIYVRGVLTNNGTISRKGSDGTNGTNAAGPVAGIGGAGGVALGSGTLYGALAGQAGGDGGGGGAGSPGVAGSNGALQNPAIVTAVAAAGKTGGAGGAGGAGGGGAGGAAGSGGTSTAAIRLNPRSSALAAYMMEANSTSSLRGGAGAGGTGGGGGGGIGTNEGGGGGGSGGSGGSGGVMVIFAKTLTNAGTITVMGGNGGNGGNGANGTPPAPLAGGGGGGGSGGSGGTGGVLVLVYGSLTDTGTITVAGGALGTKGTKGLAGGAGASNGVDGVDGNAGTAGLRINLQV